MTSLLKKTFTISAFLIFYNLLSFSWAEENTEIKLSAQLNKNQVKMGEEFILTILISGTYKTTPEIKMPDLSDFIVISSHQSSSYKIKEGEYESTIKYEIHLLPKKPGIFSIGSAELSYNHRTYRTDILTLEVLPSSEPDETPFPYKHKKIPWKSKKGIFI
ncbi:MAG: BatD family protein [Candidatus Omnitrophota bacterium]